MTREKKENKKMVQAEGMYQMAPMGYRRALLGKVTLGETLPWVLTRAGFSSISSENGCISVFEE